MFVGFTVLVLLGSFASANAQPPHVMTLNDVEAAIEFGLSKEPKPYPVRHIERPGKTPRTIIADVYTPFVRIAHAARQAKASGQTMTPASVPPGLLEPVIYVSFRPACKTQEWLLSAAYDEYEVLNPGFQFPEMTVSAVNPRLTHRPLSVSRDPHVLAEFSGTHVCERSVLVAKYSIEALFSGHDFIVSRTARLRNGSISIDYQMGRVLPSELVTWR
jgi:hypothetical protein